MKIPLRKYLISICQVLEKVHLKAQSSSETERNIIVTRNVKTMDSNNYIYIECTKLFHDMRIINPLKMIELFPVDFRQQSKVIKSETVLITDLNLNYIYA